MLGLEGKKRKMLGLEGKREKQTELKALEHWDCQKWRNNGNIKQRIEIRVRNNKREEIKKLL